MQPVPFKNKRGDVPVSLHMLSDTGANGKDTVDIHAHTSGSRAEYAAGKRIAIVCAAFLLALSLASAFPTGGMAAGTGIPFTGITVMLSFTSRKRPVTIR